MRNILLSLAILTSGASQAFAVTCPVPIKVERALNDIFMSRTHADDFVKKLQGEGERIDSDSVAWLFPISYLTLKSTSPSDTVRCEYYSKRFDDGKTAVIKFDLHKNK